MPRKYVKTGNTAEGTERRMRAFRHNGMTGHVVMMQKQLRAMLTSDTITDETSQIAAEIYALTNRLYISLKIRKD